MEQTTTTFTDTKINFCPGPATLPRIAVLEAARGIVNYEDTGLSVLEISHRSKEFEAIFEEARALVKEILGLGEEYAVLFLTGGASMQFCMVPYNLLPDNGTAAYLDTGVWSVKAIKEAEVFGKTKVIATSKKFDYTFIPKEYLLYSSYAYLHITTNNTVCGTQIHKMPTTSIPIVADMSSDIFSQQRDYSQFDLIYAGAQKNLGPAGTTLVIVKKDILGRVERKIPSMLNYQTHIKKPIFNTPPVFAIYTCLLTLRWIKSRGIKQIEADNRKKSTMLYEEIDRNPLFKGIARPEDRSMMNATFTTINKAHEPLFLKFVEAAGCVGLKGYRTFGGFRASMYNAMPVEGVATLVDLMQEFERTHG